MFIHSLISTPTSHTNPVSWGGSALLNQQTPSRGSSLLLSSDCFGMSHYTSGHETPSYHCDSLSSWIRLFIFFFFFLSALKTKLRSHSAETRAGSLLLPVLNTFSTEADCDKSSPRCAVHTGKFSLSQFQQFYVSGHDKNGL